MKKAVVRHIILLVLVILGITFFVGLSSCKSRVEYIPVESVRTEYKDKYLRDSIYLKELVRIYQKGDTIFKDSIVYKYKNKLIKDTISINDTIRVPYPIKGDTIYTNNLNWYQELSVWFTSLVLVALGLYLGLKYRGKILSFFRKLFFKI